MSSNTPELDPEASDLHRKILEKRHAFDEGMMSDMSFEQLKTLFVELKELTRQQQAYQDAADARKEEP